MKTSYSPNWRNIAVIALAFIMLFIHPTSAYGLASTTLTSDIDEVQKTIFQDPLIDNVVAESEFGEFFDTNLNPTVIETVEGRRIEMAHEFGLPGGVIAVAENDYIPTPRNPTYLNAYILLKKTIGSLEMSGDTMDKVRTDIGAFINYMERSLPLLAKRVRYERDRTLIGTGSGIIARVGTVVDGTGTAVIGLVDAFGVSTFDDNVYRQFLENQEIVFGTTAAGTTLRNAGSSQSALITSIDEANDTITISGAAALTAAIAPGDYIANGGPAGSAFPNAGVNREVEGMLAGVDDGTLVPTYHNIARANQRYWQGVMFDASAAPYNGLMSESVLIQTDDEVALRGGGLITHAVMSRNAVTGYWARLSSNRLITDFRGGNYEGGKGNEQVVVLGTRRVTLVAVRKMPEQMAFALQRDTWMNYRLGSWKWDDRTGALWNRVTDSTGRKDAFYCVGYSRENVHCSAPHKNARINGLALAQTP